MANRPIPTPPTADLPVDWVIGDAVTPVGTDAGLSAQHGYNYLNEKINEALNDVIALNEGFDNIPSKSDKLMPPVYTTGGAANAYTITDNAVTLAAGAVFAVKIHAAATSDTAHLTFNSTQGPIVRLTSPGSTSTLNIGAILALNATRLMRFDGSNFVLVEFPVPNGQEIAPVQIGPNANAYGANAIAVGANAAATAFTVIAVGNSAQATGEASTAIGSLANASAGYSAVMGYRASASGNQSSVFGGNASSSTTVGTALGYAATCTNQGTQGIAIGFIATSNGAYGIAIGSTAKALAYGSVALGFDAAASNSSSIAIGITAQAHDYAVAIGGNAAAEVASTYSTAIGYNARALSGSNHAIVIGSNAHITGSHSIAIGEYANIASNYAVVIGNGASSLGDHSTALGDGATVYVSDNNTIQLGSGDLSVLRSRVALTVTSDERDKTDIADIQRPMDFLRNVRTITYNNNEREKYIDKDALTDEQKAQLDEYGMTAYNATAHDAGEKKGSRLRFGVLAQQVQDCLKTVYGDEYYGDIVNDNLYDLEQSGAQIPDGVETKLTVAYTAFVPLLIGAVKELDGRIAAIEGGKEASA
jgi:hypothetical protein